jgi:hypothetical protein
MAEQGVGVAAVKVARISVDSELDPTYVEKFLEVYRVSMQPLEEMAPCRQSLTDEEFREEMAMSSVTRYVGWEDGEPVALCWMSNDLDHVPWISPPYYAKKFPRQYAEHLIFYISGVVVRPEARGQDWSSRLFEQMILDVARQGGMSAFDCSKFVIDVVHLDKIIEDSGKHLIRYQRHDLDTQIYLAYETFGVIGEEPVLDLTGDGAIIDLTD